ncbi:MAG: UDP-N-acetylglucosamine 1-carboxyvinyltransferase, partial [bacterium]
HRLSPDRIAAATFLCAAAATGGAVRLRNVRPAELTPVLGALARMGAAVELGGGQLFLRAPRKLVSPGRIVTGPYPGFPTDAQPLLAASCLRAAGRAEFRETVFENRFRAFAGFRLLGAEAEARGMTACITGVRSLRGTRLLAEDLRGGAALVIAALSAEGESLLLGTEHIRRGYENLPAALRALGAEMETEFAPACGA